MVQLQGSVQPAVTYPDSDGQPMADNTKQFRWIVTIKENLDWWFGDQPNVFVAGDLLWYPVEGDNKTCVAPDIMVACDRPKGDRGSYQQWLEGNIAPQVVFEILSPGNTRAEMSRKLLFYDRFGVEEYYLYDPDENSLNGWLRRDGFLDVIEPIDQWVSPRLQIRFVLSSPELLLYHPDGSPFLTFAERATQSQQAERLAEQERSRADAALEYAEQERLRANAASERAERLVKQLRSMGIEPEQL